MFESPQKPCGMGIIFIDIFHTITPVSNFVGRAGYATFSSSRSLPGGRGHVMLHVSTQRPCHLPVCYSAKLELDNFVFPCINIGFYALPTIIFSVSNDNGHAHNFQQCWMLQHYKISSHSLESSNRLAAGSPKFYCWAYKVKSSLNCLQNH